MNQLTPEWFAVRCGKVTASRIKDVMATVKSGESVSRKNYRAQIIAERLTGNVEPTYTNGAMQWGTDTEPLARAAYEVTNGVMVDQVGMILHASLDSGASPDGLVGNDGLIEIKCPNTATHIEYLLSHTVPNEYVMQMQWQMECTGRQWCDFVSYDPRMPESLQMLVIRVARDESIINKIRDEVCIFLVEVDDIINKLTSITSRQKDPAHAKL